MAAGLVAMSAAPAQAQAPAMPTPFPTPAEQAEYLSFTAPEVVGPYLGRLAASATGVSADSLPAPTPLPIVRIAPTPSSGVSGAPAVRVLVIGAQHGTERAGIEVGLRLARDLATGRLANLRRSLDVRIVPMANPWGVASRQIGRAHV